MSRVKALRLGWNEKTNVTRLDIKDPYDYDNDELEGELLIVPARGSLVRKHSVYLVDGQVADPDTIRPL